MNRAKSAKVYFTEPWCQECPQAHPLVVLLVVLCGMADLELDSLDELLDALDGALDDAESEPLVGTSVKLPANLRRAAEMARSMGLIKSTSEVAVEGLRDRLDVITQRAVLDRHYRLHPEAQPSLARVARAYAQMHGHPLANHAALIVEAADRVVKDEPEADARDVLIYATALQRERESAA